MRSLLTERDSLTLRNQAVLGILDARKGWKGLGNFSVDLPKRMMELLGNPQDKIPAIIVGGTNGKGSVCTMLASILMTKHKKVAQFTSPYLHHYTERLLIQGVPVDENKLLSAIDKVLEMERGEMELSYFELVIAASFLVCLEDKVDWMVVEVGLGGRLDATNVMKEPKAAVITSIGLDHVAVLGDTEALIAKEKAGIFRKGTPAFVGVVSPEAKMSIQECANAIGCHVDFLQENPTTDVEVPQYRANNIDLARRVATALGFSHAEIDLGISKAFWPGRLEPVKLKTDQGEQTIILDGAHNPDGIRGLIDYLDRTKAKEFVILISIITTKDSSSMISLLSDWAKGKKVTFLFCKMHDHKGVEPDILASQMGDGTCFETSNEGVAGMGKLLSNEKLGVITGSLYFIGEVRSMLVDQPFTTLRKD